MTATVYFVNRQSNYQYFLFLIIIIIFSWFNFSIYLLLVYIDYVDYHVVIFYGTFAFKRAIAHMRYVVK